MTTATDVVNQLLDEETPVAGTPTSSAPLGNGKTAVYRPVPNGRGYGARILRAFTLKGVSGSHLAYEVSVTSNDLPGNVQGVWKGIVDASLLQSPKPAQQAGPAANPQQSYQAPK